MAKQTSQRRELTPPVSDIVQDGTAYIYFDFQKRLQEFGILLMDLETGVPISGQVSHPEIGLIDPSKKRPIRRHLGFVQPKETVSQSYFRCDIDAILSFDGYADDKTPPFFIIRVIDENEVDDWIDLGYSIGLSFDEEAEGQTVHGVLVGVSGLCIPDPKNPQAAKDAMLRRFQGYGFEGVRAVSRNALKIEEDLLDKEDRED